MSPRLTPVRVALLEGAVGRGSRARSSCLHLKPSGGQTVGPERWMRGPLPAGSFHFQWRLPHVWRAGRTCRKALSRARSCHALLRLPRLCLSTHSPLPCSTPVTCTSPPSPRAPPRGRRTLRSTHVSVTLPVLPLQCGSLGLCVRFSSSSETSCMRLVFCFFLMINKQFF